MFSKFSTLRHCKFHQEANTAQHSADAGDYFYLWINKNFTALLLSFLQRLIFLTHVTRLFFSIATTTGLTVPLSSCVSVHREKALFLAASWGCCTSGVKLWGTNQATDHSSLNPPSPHRTSSNSLSLTDVNHIYVHWVWEGWAQRIGGHNSDVVVDPDGCVILVEEAGVLSGGAVVRAFVHSVWAAGGKRERLAVQNGKGVTENRKKLWPARETMDNYCSLT